MASNTCQKEVNDAKALGSHHAVLRILQTMYPTLPAHLQSERTLQRTTKRGFEMNEAMKSRRNVISEREILSVECPVCKRPFGRLCVDKNLMPLQFNLDQTEASFHAQRIIKAQDEQIKRLGFGNAVNADEKALILYYAFIMLCDSAAESSEKIFNQRYTSEELQAFFCGQAIKELRNDGLMKNGKTS